MDVLRIYPWNLPWPSLHRRLPRMLLKPCKQSRSRLYKQGIAVEYHPVAPIEQENAPTRLDPREAKVNMVEQPRVALERAAEWWRGCPSRSQAPTDLALLEWGDRWGAA